MKKMKILFPLLALLLLTPFRVLADQQLYPLPPIEGVTDQNNDFWSYEAYRLLVSGDTLHFLKYRYGGRFSTEEMDVFSAECFTLNDRGDVELCPNHCGDVIDLVEPNHFGGPFFGWVHTPQNETYLVDANGQVLRWTPHADAAWEPVTQLDMSGLSALASDYDWITYRGDEDALYLAYPSAQGGCDLYAFDWTSGERRTITHLGYAYDVTFAGHGKLLVEGGLRPNSPGDWYIIDCQTGETSVFMGGTDKPKPSLCVWDRVSGWYYASYSEIQHLGWDKNESTAGTFPGATGDRDTALSMDGRQFYVLANEREGSRFLIVDLQESDGTVLTVNGVTNYLNPQYGAISSLTGASPELANVQFDLRDSIKEANDVAQLLLTQDDSIDLLAVNTASVDLRSLFAKGYCVALDDQPEIQAFFDELYPAWSSACTWQGSIVALPLSAADEYQFMYNTELWEELELNVPTSYSELFSTIRWMDSAGLLTEYPLFEKNGIYTRSFDHLLNKLLGDFLLHGETSGLGIDLSDPVFEQLLQELSELRDILDRHDGRNLTGTPLMAHAGFVTGVDAAWLFYEQYGEYAPMLLSLDETRGPVLQANMIVLFVNPYSKHIELAKTWLSYLASNPTESTRCVLLKGMPNGIETEQSRIRYAEYEERQAALQQQYEEAQASGDMDAIEKAQDAWYSNIQPMHEWIVTPEHAQMLYPALPYARVIHYAPHVVLLNNGAQPIQEYLTGKRSAHDLLRALQSLAMMISEEGS